MNRLFRNFSYAVIAQGISYLLSIITGLVVPKMLGVDEYGYWQLFVFYGSYVNFCMLGIHDGMYLRLGGREYKDLDYAREGSQFKRLMQLEMIMAFVFMAIAAFAVDDGSRSFVFASLGIYLVLINACQYLGELFQAVNETPVFSKATMINKILYMVIVVLLLWLRVYDFRPYVIGMILCALTQMLYYLWKGKDLFKARKKYAFRNIFKYLAEDAGSGWKIMIGGYAAMLIIGFGRSVIDFKWGIATFGKLSVAISLINMVMQFINQIAIVLFPALRTVTETEQKSLYQSVRKVLFFVLPLAYFVYFPLAFLIKLWLPLYSDSITYLAVLLPMCVFDAKTNMLSLTYLKVLRKEKDILRINVLSLLLNVILIVVGLSFFDNLYTILLAMVASGVIRSVVFDIYMMKVFKVNTVVENLIEITFMFTFVIGNLLAPIVTLSLIVIEYVVLALLLRHKDLSVFKKLMKKF